MNPTHNSTPEPPTAKTARDRSHLSGSVFAWLSLPLRYPRLLLGTPILFSVLAVAASLLSRQYTATTQFIPEASASPLSGIPALAGQFGIQIGPARNGESLDFYARLLKSREILGRIAAASYRVRVGADTVTRTFIDIYEIAGDSRAETILAAVDQLRATIAVTTDYGAGMITVDVSARSPELAEQVSRRLLVEVQEFDLNRRQFRAREERRFVARRLTETESELQSAEGELERFYEDNRSYQDSPRLLVLLSRLQRTVTLRQQVYTGLVQSYEQARIEEVRNTPVITIVDPPEGSAVPSASLVVMAILGLILGAFLGVGIVGAKEYIGRERRDNPKAYNELASLLLATLSWFARSPTSRRIQ